MDEYSLFKQDNKPGLLAFGESWKLGPSWISLPTPTGSCPKPCARSAPLQGVLLRLGVGSSGRVDFVTTGEAMGAAWSQGERCLLAAAAGDMKDIHLVSASFYAVFAV